MLPSILQEVELSSAVRGSEFLRACAEAARCSGESPPEVVDVSNVNRRQERTITWYRPIVRMKNGSLEEMPRVRILPQPAYSDQWWDFCVCDGAFYEPLTIDPGDSHKALVFMSVWPDVETPHHLVVELAKQLKWYVRRVQDVLNRHH